MTNNTEPLKVGEECRIEFEDWARAQPNYSLFEECWRGWQGAMSVVYAKIAARLGCHPAMLMQEIDQLTERADSRPTADEYRQLQIAHDNVCMMYQRAAAKEVVQSHGADFEFFAKCNGYDVSKNQYGNYTDADTINARDAFNAGRRTAPSPAEVASEPIYQARNKSEKQWSEVSKAKFDFYADAPEIGVEVRILYLRQDSVQQVAAPCGCLIDGEEDQAEWCQRHLALKRQLDSIASAQRYELDDASGSMVPREDGQWIQHAYLKSTGAHLSQQSPARVEGELTDELVRIVANRIGYPRFTRVEDVARDICKIVFERALNQRLAVKEGEAVGDISKANWPFPYDKTFKAIGNAVHIEGGNLAISVMKFREAFGPLSTHPVSDDQQAKDAPAMVLFGYATGEHLDKLVPPGIGKTMTDVVALYAKADFTEFEAQQLDALSTTKQEG